ncbi:MAG: zf-HC2 domain-containing protein [Planctomycetota bacterium]
MRSENDCHKIREQLVAYLDGELDAAEREVVDIHLAGCTACRREMDGFESTDDLLGSLGGAIVPERDLAAAVLKQAKEGDPWCRHIRRELVAFSDGELDADAARPIEEHLSQCEECRAERDLVVASGDALAAWTIPEFTGDLVPRVRPSGTTKTGRGILRRLVPALAAACVVVIASVAVLIGTGGPETPLVLNGNLADYEAAAVKAGVGPDLITDENLHLVMNQDWLEAVPDLNEFGLLAEGGD